MRYNKRKSKYLRLLDKEKKVLKRVELARILTVVLALVFIMIGYFTDSNMTIVTSLCIFIGVFILLLLKTNGLKTIIGKYQGLVDVYDMGIKRVEGNWIEIEEDGSEYIDKDHRYTWDLDIFGKGSLFQFINTSRLKEAKERLRDLLSGDIEFTIDELNQRQQAVIELSNSKWFREKLQSIDNRSKKTDKDINHLIKWVSDSGSSYNKRGLKYLVNIMPILFIASVAYGFINDRYALAGIVFIINLCIIGIGYKKRDKVLRAVSSYNESIGIYKEMMKHIENHSFKSGYLNGIKDKLKTNDEYASKYIARLNKLTNSIANRDNAYFLIINIIMLWDIRFMINTNKWKDEIKLDFEEWLNALAMFTTLSSLGFVKYENPDWGMPCIIEEDIVSGENLGHPLITKGRVGNTFAMDSKTNVMLVTGSNMAGKSTFLRSIAINMVMGNIGSPVCSESMTYNRLPIYTCMRVSDDLKRNISSFFYELLRIKMMNEVSKETKIFFVLDEIFKGTNSYDRHYGAKTIIKSFIKYGCRGLVSTHDLELGELEEELNGHLKNYSFAEHYLDNEILFDYKLIEGISTTRNARKLMEMLGLL